MKKFELNLSKYEVTVKVPNVRKDDNDQEIRELVDKQVAYPLIENIAGWLRAPGVFKSGEEIVEAITLAKRLLAGEDKPGIAILDEREAEVLKKCLNRHIEVTADQPNPLGGPIHEEAICRIFGMKEVE